MTGDPQNDPNAPQDRADDVNAPQDRARDDAPERTYRIIGRVIDRATERGVPGLRVETWDRDTIYHDLLGEKVTDRRGAFEVRFDSNYFGDFAPDRAPDLFFRVYQDRTLVKSTEGTVMVNVAEGDTEVTILVDMGTEAEADDDRIGSRTVLSGLQWFQRSDFRCVGSEADATVRSVGRLMVDAARSRVKDGRLPGICRDGVRTRQVVGQDVESATSNLERNQVQVASVESYDAAVDDDPGRLLTRWPTDLKAGDSVRLYERDGAVRYYAVVRDDDGGQDHDGQGDDGVRDTLAGGQAGTEAVSADAATREELAERDERIERLEAELVEMRDRQAAMDAMEADLARLRSRLDRLDQG